MRSPAAVGGLQSLGSRARLTAAAAVLVMGARDTVFVASRLVADTDTLGVSAPDSSMSCVMRWLKLHTSAAPAGSVAGRATLLPNTSAQTMAGPVPAGVIATPDSDTCMLTSLVLPEALSVTA